MRDSALDKLGPKDRLRLLRFVCSFAWTDWEIRREEREFVAQLMDRLGLEEEEREKVHGWLHEPPPPDAVDPSLIPTKHRKLFLEALEGVVAADGEISPAERDDLEIFEQLLA